MTLHEIGFVGGRGLEAVVFGAGVSGCYVGGGG